jgi:tight adherence protein C
MKRVFNPLLLIILLFSNCIFAVDFENLTQDQQFEMYFESCEKDQYANCYQVARWFIKNKRIDPIDERNSRFELNRLTEERKSIKIADDQDDLSDEDLAKLQSLRTKLSKENQEKQSLKKAKDFYQKACDGGEKIACKEMVGIDQYEGATLLYYTALFLIGLAVFLIAKTIFQDEDQFQAQEKLDDNKSQNEDIAKHGIILRYSRPFFKRYFSPIVSGMKNKKKFKDQYRRKLAAAGLTNILSPEDFFAFKLFLIIGFPILFLAVRVFLEETWPLQLIPLIALVGFFYPDFWIKGKIDQRRLDVIRAMPFCVDMLALSVEAGLDFVAAMAKVIEKAKTNPLTEEFEILIKEIKIGASRAEALRNLAWRIDLIQISSFSATLIAADSVGASIGPILKSLAGEIRQKKSSEVEKAGATAATKILFPMLFLIVPSVLMIVFAPIVMEALNGR